MATSKKPTAAQIKARERFAAMARSGAFTKKRKPAAKKSTRKTATKRAVNPIKPAAKTPRYVVCLVKTDGTAGTKLGAFAKREDALLFGKTYATKNKRRVCLTSGK